MKIITNKGQFATKSKMSTWNTSSFNTFKEFDYFAYFRLIQICPAMMQRTEQVSVDQCAEDFISMTNKSQNEAENQNKKLAEE